MHTYAQAVSQSHIEQMSRHERLAQRLRGAGRVAINNSPVAFKSRHAKTPGSKPAGLPSTKATKTPSRARAGLDVLIPITSSSINTSSKRQLKAKMMDFSTPKTTKKQKATSASAKKINPHKVEHTQLEETTSTSIAARPLSSSTPEKVSAVIETMPLLEHFNLTPMESASPIAFVAPVESEIVLLPVTDLQESDHNGRADSPASTRKRKLIDTDMQMPVNMSPSQKPKKKLRGLLRELGPGASRFIIGAPNFATPARRKSGPSQVDYSHVARKSHRISRANESHSMLDVSDLPVVKSSRTKLKKACQDCNGTKAWNRWHAISDRFWRCNRCQQLQGTACKPGKPKKNNGRLATALTDDEHVLVVVRRRQGRSYDSIARELKKWKTGQSVRKYLEKEGSIIKTRDLEELIERALSCNEAPVINHGRSRQKARAITGRKMTVPKIVKHFLQAGLAECDPDESDILVSL